jgi:hypothetical protein
MCLCVWGIWGRAWLPLFYISLAFLVGLRSLQLAPCRGFWSVGNPVSLVQFMGLGVDVPTVDKLYVPGDIASCTSVFVQSKSIMCCSSWT